jgi:hypothetical protein
MKLKNNEEENRATAERIKNLKEKLNSATIK